MSDLFAQPCPACIEASLRPSWLFRKDCKGCEARALARGPDFHRCRVAGRQDKPYRELLARVGTTHEAVLQWAEMDKERTCRSA